MENVPGHALGMHANQRGSGSDISHDERDSFFDAAIAVLAMLRAEAVNAELSPTRRELRGGYLLNWTGHTLIIAVERGKRDIAT